MSHDQRNGKKPGHAWLDSTLDGKFDQSGHDELAGLPRRFDLLLLELKAMRESFDSKFERLLALHERDALHRDDVNQRLEAYLTRGLSTEKRVDALEDAVTPIASAPRRRNPAARKK